MENMEKTEIVMSENASEGDIVMKYTDAQVNDIIKKEKMKLLTKLGVPDVESAVTVAQMGEKLKKENEELAFKVAESENRNKVLIRDVSPEFTDFVIYEITKRGGNFDEELDNFLNDHPTYRKGGEPNNWAMRQESGLSPQNGIERAFYAMNPGITN